MKKLHSYKDTKSTEWSIFSDLAQKSISLYQKEISSHKGYRCAHAQCRGGMSCSAFIQNVIQSSPDGHLSPETKQRIAERLRECKSMSTIAGLSTYQATKKILLTAGAIGAGVFLISATAFAATCDDSGSGGGCGGGGGGSNDAIPKDCTVINSIVVPPEPDAKANAATIAGVDSNNNGVRDDVERKAAEIATNKAPFDAHIQIAKDYSIIMDEKSTPSAVVNSFISLGCLYQQFHINELEDVGTSVVNNKNREDAYNRAYLKALDNGLSVDGYSCEK